MQEARAPHLVYLQVCEHERPGEKCCFPDGPLLREKLKSQIKELKLSHKIRVMRTGCFDLCSKGPNVILMPDKIWFQQVTEADLPAIIERAVASLPPEPIPTAPS